MNERQDKRTVRPKDSASTALLGAHKVHLGAHRLHSLAMFKSSITPASAYARYNSLSRYYLHADKLQPEQLCRVHGLD